MICSDLMREAELWVLDAMGLIQRTAMLVSILDPNASCVGGTA